MSDFPSASGPDGEVLLTELLQREGEVLTALDVDHLDRLDSDRLLSQMSLVAHLVRGGEAVLAAMSAEVAVRSDPVRGTDGLAAKHTYQRPSQLVEVVTGVSAAAASRLIRVGQKTSPRLSDAGLPLPVLFPFVGEALREGLIGVEAAENITRELTLAAPRAAVEHLAIAEASLVGQAVGGGWRDGLPLSADLVGVQARLWRDRLDEDGIEPRAQKAFEKRDFWISRSATPEGLVRFGGQVTVDVGTKLHALFDAILSPRTDCRYLPPDEDTAESVDGTGTGTDTDTDTDTELPSDGTDPARDAGLRDVRSAGQKRADVFAAMIDALARSADVPTVTGASPTVVVSVTADVLERQAGTGQIVGINSPVAFSTIKQILCDASVVPVFLDPDGSVVALGNNQRRFNRSQRLGMIARDGPTCAMDDCQIPATGCEAHHIQEYSEGGPTHIDNGALFCWFHHRMIDTGVFTVTMVNGKPKVSIADWIRRKPYFQ
ncbi:hypothetical protein L1277_002656 [Okibacterium sp. HSC-33S16]|uniref:HNH endonuclease signature motif containing protein n=1 Tax=Okibacterium sp. HSC-33S16 TaxID=2910965 RepID=UPI00209D24F5|nr:HNH endonuclease signature motif containing protein [Okibacterium sp. HSC-33S16]MCP2032553.1 hypothetical protein [Okibacterium sp. HSC-33S16]